MQLYRQGLTAQHWLRNRKSVWTKGKTFLVLLIDLTKALECVPYHLIIAKKIFMGSIFLPQD